MNFRTETGTTENTSRSADPFGEAKERLLPSLRNRALAEAAGALANNNIVSAEMIVARHLAKKPNDAEALNLQADIARRLRKFEDAERLLSRCLELDPRSRGYRYNYAIVLRRLHRYEEALVQIEHLLKDEPDNPLFRDQRASILTWLGRHDDALACLRALSEDFPSAPDIWLRYGHALRNAGLGEKCIAAYRTAIRLGPSLTAPYGSLADLKIYRFPVEDIVRMESLLQNPVLGPEDRAPLHHALGVAYAQAGNYTKSFDNYAKCNALRRLNITFDPGQLTAQRLVAEKFFTGDFFRARANWGCKSQAPIFVVGLPRSGSTLLEQILCSHSAIEGLGERSDLDIVLVPPLARFREEVELGKFADGSAVDKGGLVNAYVRVFDRLDAGQFRLLGEQFLKMSARERTTDRPHFTDKTLRNFFYVGLIQLILPHAKIIDVRRHPLDCGWSCFKSQFDGHHYAKRLSDIGNDYANYVRLMAHFDRVLPGRIHRVIYEELVSNPHDVVRRLFVYLELPFEERCLHFYENQRAVITQSSEQVRRPLYRSGIDQWRPYESWLGPLKSALGEVLDRYPNAPD